MIMLAVLLRLELHPHPEVGQRSQDLKRHQRCSGRIACWRSGGLSGLRFGYSGALSTALDASG